MTRDVAEGKAQDNSLVEGVLGGNRDKFRELVEKYQERIFRLVDRLVGNPTEAEDLTQQSFIEAFMGLRRYDRSRSFLTWLMSIAINNCRDHLKSHKRRERQLTGEVDEREALFMGHIPNPHQVLESQQNVEQIAKAFHRLDAKYRIPLLLKDVEELDYKEMQEILHLPLTTLKMRVIRARAQLQEQLSWLNVKS
jgi:RNA polymerase sigma-70 factor, ECF subfamily